MDTKLITIMLLCASADSLVFAQKDKTDIPRSITTPDKVESRLGSLEFKDGVPNSSLILRLVCGDRGLWRLIPRLNACGAGAIISGGRKR
jgi:hypothetical protein